MAAFVLVTLQPPGYPHVAAFTDIKLVLLYSLRDLGHSVSLATNHFPVGATAIVFGAHLISDKFGVELPEDCLIFNTEQLMSQGSVWSERLFRLAQQHRILDYASANLMRLRERTGSDRLHRFRLGYHQELERVPIYRSDEEGFLFYGSVSPLRQQILSRIQLSDHLRVSAFFGVYGWQRDGLLARCRAVLNLHSHPARLLEWPRIFPLIANAVPCIALLHPQTISEDNQTSYLLSAAEALPTPDLEHWFQQPEQLRLHALEARERFREHESQIPYTTALLDETLASGFVPAPGPMQTPDWIPCPAQRDPDVLWYQQTYPQIGSGDPRSVMDFHREEGALLQLHPDRSFVSEFRSPLYLRPGTSSPRSGVSALRFAVILHLESLETAQYFFASFVGHLVGYADLLFTTASPLIAALVRSLAADYGANIRVCLIEDRGRDVPSKYLVFNQAINANQLCLFARDKGPDLHWFDDHFRPLAGSADRVDSIVDLFSSDPSLGLLFPDYLPSQIHLVGWGQVRRHIDRLLEPLNFTTKTVELLEFPIGGFFWARPQALGLLHALGLDWAHLPQNSEILEHPLLDSLERMPCLSCEVMGLRWEKIARYPL
jgi:hypothetical protein